MTDVPEIRYAQSGEVSIAYHATGSGPVDLVIVPGLLSHLEYLLQEPNFVRWLDQLRSFARVILFDKRGTGLSDRTPPTDALEERMDDLRAVLDAVGSEKAAILGFSEGGSLAILFASTYPERTRSLIALATFACSHEAPGYPAGGLQRPIMEEMIELAKTAWGEGRGIDRMVPSLAEHPSARTEFGRFERMSASPSAVRHSLEWILRIDVREIAKTVRVPTLVLHRIGDAVVPVESGRWLADNIQGARYEELPGDDHPPWFGDGKAIADEVRRFVMGSRHVVDVEGERVLTTVLFTDIVASTQRAAEVGDRAWSELLQRHHVLVRRELESFRGREIDNAGDGFFATFDGPARAVRCARSIGERVAVVGVQIRAGIHTGECEVSGEKVVGINVHTGARILAKAEPGEVLVSQTVMDLVAGSGLTFEDRGEHGLKGIPGLRRLYRAV